MADQMPQGFEGQTTDGWLLLGYDEYGQPIYGAPQPTQPTQPEQPTQPVQSLQETQVMLPELAPETQPLPQQVVQPYGQSPTQAYAPTQQFYPQPAAVEQPAPQPAAYEPTQPYPTQQPMVETPMEQSYQQPTTPAGGQLFPAYDPTLVFPQSQFAEPLWETSQPQAYEPTLPYPGAAYPGQPAPESAYPSQPAPEAVYPGQPAPGTAYPGQPAPDGAYPGQPAMDAGYPGQPSEAAYPARPTEGATYPDQPGEPVAPVAAASADRAGARPMSGLGIAAFVLGLIAIAGSFIPVINIGSLVPGALAIIFGIIALVQIGKGRNRGRGLSIAGLACGVVACVIVVVLQVALVNAVDDAMSTNDSINQFNNGALSDATSPNGSASSGSSSGDASSGSSTDADDAMPGGTTGDSGAEDVEGIPYTVTIDSARRSTNLEGDACITVTFTFTNESDETTKFSYAVRDQAFQNNVELEPTYVADDNMAGLMQDVKPGGTITCEESYILRDESPVTVECRQLWGSPHESSFVSAIFTLS